MSDMNVVRAQTPQLKNVESFIKDYKKLSQEDVRNIKRMSYEDLQTTFRKDPVKFMVEAADLGMDLGQYGNMIAPDTRLEQDRNIVHRLMEDEAIYIRETDMSAPSTVRECLDGGYRQALLFYALTKAWEKSSIQDRNSIQLPTSAPLHTPPNTSTVGQPAPVAVGLRLNPGELVATSHSVDTNAYSPFSWVYDKADMQRNKVAPGEPIPASTLAESSGNIPMSKWGNRFVIPYEMLTGGQGLRVNKLAQMVALDAATESNRQFVELLETLENGDGVKDAGTVEGITTYDGTAGTFGFAAFLNWLDEALTEPFQISHVIMLKEQQRELRTSLSALEGRQAFQQLSSVGLAPNAMSNMEGQGSVRYGRAPDGAITASRVIGIDARFAVEKVNRAGMTIRQQAENIANQTRDVVISDTYLWARLAQDAVKVLNVAT